MTPGYSFLRTMPQTRSKGHTATGVVCYRFALAATSTLPGADGRPRLFDYSRRTGVAATGYAAPVGAHESWRDPITWAHRIEAVDRRKNSRQCRDDVIAIPVELVEAGLAVPGIQAYQPVAKVADPAWRRRDRARTVNGHGDGQETGGAPSVADVGGHGGPSDE